jgi:23S rRNA (cytosine1962-C5)-methyltransferase
MRIGKVAGKRDPISRLNILPHKRYYQLLAMHKIFLKPTREKSVLNHHPWLFSGAIDRIEGTPENGEIVQVYSAKQVFLGNGFYNSTSQMRVRFMSFKEEVIDLAFWAQRLQEAVSLRTQIIDSNHTNAYRLIHGEGDGFPGLVVDRYADILVMQISSSGMERLRSTIIEVLKSTLQPRALYERSDVASRKVEGLPLRCQPVFGNTPEMVTIMENDLKFKVSIAQGQKTGFFLDQRNNRKRVGELAKDKKVLNCFAYSGGFSVYAAAGGATSVVSVDISPAALKLAEENFQINNLDSSKHTLFTADAFELLREYKNKNEKFDLIILDPPAFVKNQGSVPDAARGYKDINLQAISIMQPNGILVTCSCSQHIDRMLFQKIVHDAAIDAGRDLQILEISGQSADHPININHPEGEYLKCLIARVR